MSELLTLLDRAQNGDNDACQQVLTENVGLIWSIVKRYSGCGVDTDDLYQLGCIGFIKAVKGFDLTYGTQFSTYAVPKIAGEIRRFSGMTAPSRWAAASGKRARPCFIHVNDCAIHWEGNRSCQNWRRRRE